MAKNDVISVENNITKKILEKYSGDHLLYLDHSTMKRWKALLIYIVLNIF